MRVLLLDSGGHFLDFALQCVHAGHQVKWYTTPLKNGESNTIGDGLIEKVKDWRKWMGWGDLICLSDNDKFMVAMEPFRKLGYPIFGCNCAGAEMELNRTIGQKILKDAGVKIMDYKTFTSPVDAEAFVRKNMKRYVSKPNDDADKAMSYVSKSPADMIYMLKRWQKNGSIKKSFILQEFIPGIEVAVGGWFGPHGFSDAININFEHKKLMNEELGVNTGEMGTVIAYVPAADKLAKKVLYPVIDYLKSINYTGYIDVSVIIDAEGNPLPLEFTCRPGWPHFQIISSLNNGDPAMWMADLLNGYDTLDVKEGVATGVAITIPDFPYNKADRTKIEGIPVYCDQSTDIHPYELKAGIAPTVVGNKVVDMPTWVSAGTYLCVVTGVAKTVSGSARKAYDAIKTIEIPNSPGYRTDIGKRLQTQLPELHKLGFCKTINY